MRFFVYEYTCGGELACPLPRSLRAEGQAMLLAVMEDMARIPGVELLTIVNPSCECALPGQVQRITSGEEEAVFRRLARLADHSLIIAPEFDDILFNRCRWVEEAGGSLLGPSSDAVRLTGDKLLLGQHLSTHGVPTPPLIATGGEVVRWWGGEERTPPLHHPTTPPPHHVLDQPLVLKPRFGAGSQATFLVANANELSTCLKQAESEGWQGEMILQRYVPGLPVSASVLLGPHQCLALQAGEQHLSDDGRFCYRGGSLPLSSVLSERAFRLACQAVEAVPGLMGYVGVDMVLGATEDGSQDRVIEINPRLTTSYVGLRALALFNLAEAMLHVVTGKETPVIRWRQIALCFRPDGSVG